MGRKQSKKKKKKVTELLFYLKCVCAFEDRGLTYFLICFQH